MAYTLASFAAAMQTMPGEIEEANKQTLEKAAEMIQTEAKRVIGTYDYDWTPLAEATKADRVAQGYPADEPLLRSGEMRDSIEHRIVEPGKEAEIGSDNILAVYQELGTATVPARSFLMGAAMHEMPAIEQMVGDKIAVVMTPSR